MKSLQYDYTQEMNNTNILSDLAIPYNNAE